MKSRKCLLLSYTKYGDYDAVIKVFSVECGYESFFLKGIYSSKNKKKAYLFALNEIEIFLTPVKAGAMQNVSKIELVEDRYFTDMKKVSVIMFAADFLNHILKNERENSNIYSEINTFISNIYQQKIDAYLALMFNILKHHGIVPLNSSNMFLNPESGQFINMESSRFFNDKVSIIWKNYLNQPDNYQIKLNKTERTDFLESMLMYYKIHFPGFRVPDSLDVLKQVYE